MEFALKFIGFVSAVNTVILICIIIWRSWLYGKGISPLIYRLGKGIACRKIAIFANTNDVASLEHILSDSGVFDKKNILSITRESEISRAEAASVYLVHWSSFETNMKAILRMKTDNTALIVFAPRNEGVISQDWLGQLGDTRNTSVTNFRGRLLSDVLVSMMTTSYSVR